MKPLRVRHHEIAVGLIGLLLALSAITASGRTERHGISSVAASEEYYAAAFGDRTIRIWDSITQEIIHTILDPTEVGPKDERVFSVRDLAFSPGGEWLAASFSGGNMLPGFVRIFDTTAGNMVAELSAWSASGDIAWSPDGTQLAARAVSGAGSRFRPHLMVWNIPSGEAVLDQLGGEPSILNISWSPDGSQVATADESYLYLSDAVTWTRELSTEFSGATDVTDIAWSPDGSQIAGVDARSTVYIVDVSTGQTVRILAGTSSNEYIRKFAWSEGNRIAVTGTGQILIWDAITGNLLSIVQVPSVMDIAWFPDGRLLYGGSGTLTEPEIVTIDTPPPARAVLFSTVQNGNRDIYAMRPDGSDVQRVLAHAGEEWMPEWSPDGTRISFVADWSGNWDIYTMAADGSDIRQLTSTAAWDDYPDWSPDGTQLVFESNRDGDFDLYVMNADGSNVRQLTHNTALDRYAVWSPDGGRIAFVSDRDGNQELYVVNVDGTGLQRLTSHPAADRYPAWVPDGSGIIFFSDRDGPANVYRLNANLADVQLLIGNNGGFPENPVSWSPDGSQLIFASNRDSGDFEIWRADADGSGLVALTANTVDDHDPDWK